MTDPTAAEIIRQQLTSDSRPFDSNAVRALLAERDQLAEKLAVAVRTIAELAEATTETRIEWATLQHWPSDGTEEITSPVEESLARRRITNYPKMHTALMHREVHYGPWIQGEPVSDPVSVGQHAAADAIEELTHDWLAQRHRPLTDAPIDRIPTPAGRRLVDDYRAHRTQQHPTGTCAECGQTIYLENNGSIGWHPIGERPDLRTCPGSGSRPKEATDA